MKKITMLIVLLYLSVFHANAATIKRVDLYPNGMKVIFEIDAAPNVNVQIPAAFNIDSIRPLPSQKVSIDYFQKSIEYNNNNIPEMLLELNKKIREKEADVATLAAKINATQHTLEMINNLTSRDINAQHPTEYVKSLFDLYTENNINNHLLTIKHKEAKEELTHLQDNYTEQLPDNNKQIINISMGIKGEGKALLEAFSNAAGWIPAYKMNLNSKTGVIDASFIAQAYQKTGINYNGPINFNTQHPRYGMLYVPKANPMIIDFQSEPIILSEEKNSFKMDGIEAEHLYMIQSEAIAPPPVITESLTNFSISGKGYIKGDGTSVSIDLGSTKHLSDLKVILFNDLSNEGSLIATLDNIPAPFLRGTAELSVDGVNSGKTQLANYGRGENVTIPFGLIPLIKVNKIPNIPKSGRGMFSGDSLNEGYILEVINGSEITASIELIDRIPYSANNKIIVDSIVIEPKEDIHEHGVLTWKMTLHPKESKKFQVEYRIKHPSDKKIIFH